jgi:hypothetical protein
VHGGDSRAFPGLQAFQAGIGHSDGFKREIVFPDAMLGQKRTGRQRDTIPRRGQGDRLALEVGIGSDLRPGDQAVDRICRLHAYRHGIRAIQHGIDEKPAIGRRHVGTATALYRGLVAFQGSLRITVGSRDRILDHVNADTRLREKVLLLRDNERQAREALGVRVAQRRHLRRRSALARSAPGRNDSEYDEKYRCGPDTHLSLRFRLHVLLH